MQHLWHDPTIGPILDPTATEGMQRGLLGDAMPNTYYGNAFQTNLPQKGEWEVDPENRAEPGGKGNLYIPPEELVPQLRARIEPSYGS